MRAVFVAVVPLASARGPRVFFCFQKVTHLCTDPSYSRGGAGPGPRLHEAAQGLYRSQLGMVGSAEGSWGPWSRSGNSPTYPELLLASPGLLEQQRPKPNRPPKPPPGSHACEKWQSPWSCCVFRFRVPLSPQDWGGGEGAIPGAHGLLGRNGNIWAGVRHMTEVPEPEVTSLPLLPASWQLVNHLFLKDFSLFLGYKIT